MADRLGGAVPEGTRPYTALVTGALGPLTRSTSNGGFRFGALPVLAEAGAVHGVPPPEIARASPAGRAPYVPSPLVPAVRVPAGMAKAEFGDRAGFPVKRAALTPLVVLAEGLLFGTT